MSYIKRLREKTIRKKIRNIFEKAVKDALPNGIPQRIELPCYVDRESADIANRVNLKSIEVSKLLLKQVVRVQYLKMEDKYVKYKYILNEEKDRILAEYISL